MGSDNARTAKGGLGPDQQGREDPNGFSRLSQLSWHLSPTVCTKFSHTEMKNGHLGGRMREASWRCSPTENRHSIDPDLFCIHFPAPSPSANDFLPHSTCFYFLSRSSAWPISKTQIHDTGRQIYLQAMPKQMVTLF